MKKSQIIAGSIAGLLIIYLLTNIIVDKKLENLRSELDTKIDAQKEIVIKLASMFGGGTVTPEAVKVAPECSDKEVSEYDALLSSLDQGLSKISLNRLNILFKQCGNVAAARRVVMTIQLRNNVNLLNEFVNERAILGKFSIEDTNINKWKDLVDKEEQISDSFTKLVVEQGSIISTLVEGTSPTSVTVENIRSSAQRIRESLNTVTSDAYKLRAELTNS